MCGIIFYIISATGVEWISPMIGDQIKRSPYKYSVNQPTNQPTNQTEKKNTNVLVAAPIQHLFEYINLGKTTV